MDEVLISIQTLERVHCFNHIGNEGAIAIAQALQTNQILKELYFSGNEIGDEGAIALAQALQTNQTLEDLIFLMFDLPLKL